MLNAIEKLKEKVKSNLTDIQNNQKEIRDLLKQAPSSARTMELEAKYALNKVLLAENNDFINVQLTMSNFIDKYSNREVFESELVSSAIRYRDENECFELTINGKLNFNQSHPFYNHDSFYQKLIQYYQNLEDYETCSVLVKTKSQQ